MPTSNDVQGQHDRTVVLTRIQVRGAKRVGKHEENVTERLRKRYGNVHLEFQQTSVSGTIVLVKAVRAMSTNDGLVGVSCVSFSH